MGNETLDKPQTGTTPFTLLYGEEIPSEAYSKSEWLFSADTQGLASCSTTSQDKIFLTNSSKDPDLEDLITRFG